MIRPLVGLLFLGLFAGVAPAHAVAKEPLKVLLTGDSITQGFNGDFTWRYRLDKEFIRQGVPVDFVGSRHDPYAKPGWSSAQYAAPNFDRDHFAQASSTLQAQAARIKDEVTTQQPDLIVLMAGINDLRGGTTAATTNARLRTWISRAREARPDVRLVISPVLDAREPARPSLSTTISQFDQMLGPTVRALSTPQSPITMADTTRGWSVTTHTSDDLHPSAYGETLIAQRIAECLKTIGLLPQTPSIYHWTPWNRQPRLKIVMQGTHAVLSWDWQAISSARVSIQRVGHKASFAVTRYGRGTMTTSALVQRAKYDFRVQLIRGRMATPLGPATRVTVSVARRPARVGRVTVDATGVRWTPSAQATSYRVAFKRAKARRWITRRTTTALSVGAVKAVRAKVWAVNSAGRSRVRVGIR
ncbi:MAG: lipolytic protein family [Marmoricola sp.]|nr:lipolytic protein family [Marmoricola sp.]